LNTTTHISIGRLSKRFFPFLFFVFLCSSCNKTNFDKQVSIQQAGEAQTVKPNIILIVADDIGYEIPTCNGGRSYVTPAINNLAKSGIRFTQCHVCPNCAPTRIELLTGKYGFRNYTQWGHLDTTQKTFVNMLQDAGYKTCVAGKWQLDGGGASIKKFGFDKYLVLDPFRDQTEGRDNNRRYKNPLLFEKGNFLADSVTKGRYADDMFAEYISNFIDKNVNNSFFVYFPLSLCHPPFFPTPDDAEFASWDPLKDHGDTAFFPSMVKYMDKKVKQIKDKISSVGLASNTIIIFMGDNGTPQEISSLFKDQKIQGGKATSTVYGTHVPLIVSCPTKFLTGQASTGLIDASDFLPTIANMAKLSQPKTYGPLDGISFYPLLFGSTERLRDWIYCYWNPQFNQDIFRVWVQDEKYKLYDSTNEHYFFDIRNDPNELTSIPPSQLDHHQKPRRNTFDSVLQVMHN